MVQKWNKILLNYFLHFIHELDRLVLPKVYLIVVCQALRDTSIRSLLDILDLPKEE